MGGTRDLMLALVLASLIGYSGGLFLSSFRSGQDLIGIMALLTDLAILLLIVLEEFGTPYFLGPSL